MPLTTSTFLGGVPSGTPTNDVLTLTILDAMNAAKSRPHGITFGYSGTGATALLTDIDAVASTGGGAARKNWQYWVNTTYGDRSFAAFELQALDVVFWRYATEQGK